MEYNIEMTVETGVKLAFAIKSMTEGGASSKEQRDRVSEKIKETFPDAFKEGGAPPKTIGELKLNKREIRAVAHGIIDIIDRDNRVETIQGKDTFISGSSGEVFSHFKKLAKEIKIWNYIANLIKADNAPEFDGDLDDTPDIINDEPDSESKKETKPDSESKKEDKPDSETNKEVNAESKKEDKPDSEIEEIPE